MVVGPVSTVGSNGGVSVDEAECDRPGDDGIVGIVSGMTEATDRDLTLDARGWSECRRMLMRTPVSWDEAWVGVFTRRRRSPESKSRCKVQGARLQGAVE